MVGSIAPHSDSKCLSTYDYNAVQSGRSVFRVSDRNDIQGDARKSAVHYMSRNVAKQIYWYGEVRELTMYYRVQAQEDAATQTRRMKLIYNKSNYLAIVSVTGGLEHQVKEK